MIRSWGSLHERTEALSRTPALCYGSNAKYTKFLPSLAASSDTLPVYLIERSGIVKAAVPHLVHYPRSMHVIFAARSVHDG